MKIHNILITLCAAILLAACLRPSRELTDIDSIIETDPAAALEALEQVDPATLQGADTAYYALLYTQALIKNHIPVNSDSLISKAYHHYASGSDDQLRKRAAFYRAQVAFNRKDYPGAMRDVLPAYEIAKKHRDHYWTAKSAELISDIYFNSYNYWQAETYTAEAASEYLAAGKELNHRYALCDLATIYLNEERIDDGLMILDSLLILVCHEQPLDSALLNYLRQTRIPSLIANEVNDSLEAVMEIKTEPKFCNENKLAKNLALAYVSTDRNDFETVSNLLDSAYNYVQSFDQKAQVMYADYKLALASENYKKAAILADSLIYAQGHIAEECIRDAITCVQRNYYENETVELGLRNKLMLTILIITIIFVVIIVILLIINYQSKLRVRNIELENAMESFRFVKTQGDLAISENQKLIESINEYSNVITNLKAQITAEGEHNKVIESLFRDKWGTLNMLCNEYFDIDENKTSQAILYKNIEKEVKRLTSKKHLREIESAVNMYMNQIVTKLRTECTFLSEGDCNFLMLIIAGFSPRAVCMFTGNKYRYFYVKKTRLIKRISDSDAPNKTLFIQKITK